MTSRFKKSVLVLLAFICWAGFAATSDSSTTAASATASVDQEDSVDQEGVVLAVFEGGEVHLRDVLREMRFLPKDERRYRSAQGTPMAQQWRDWVHREALRRITQERMATESWDDDPWLREKARQAARDWGLSIWRQRCYGLPFEEPNDAALLAQLPSEAKMTPARLRLSHIFLRAEGDPEVEEATRRLESWRQDINDLETFHRMAKERSESQSARKDGKLGFLRQGWLPKTVEDVLYALPEGSISPPLAGRGGVHLFFVEKNEPARPMPRDQELRRLRGKVRHEALEGCRQQRLREAEPPAAVADPAVGSWNLSTALAERIYGRPNTSLEETTQRLVEREALYQWALANEQFEDDERRRLDDLELNNFLGALVQRDRRPFVVEPTDSEVRGLYDGRPDAFKTPLRLSLWVVRAQVPEGADPLEFLRRMETLASSLAEGAQRWAALEKETSGSFQVERWDGLPAMDVSSRTSPFLMSQLAPLPEGSTTEVIQDGADFFIVHVAKRQEPTRKPFEEVKAQLRRGLMKERNRQASEKAVQLLLEGAQLRWTEEGLEHLEQVDMNDSRVVD